MHSIEDPGYGRSIIPHIFNVSGTVVINPFPGSLSVSVISIKLFLAIALVFDNRTGVRYTIEEFNGTAM